MSATTQDTPAAPPALEIAGPVVRVPSLDELERLTQVPDRRVVFRGVNWAFYEGLVDAIPERCDIHVDYDGKDLEIMGKGRRHERRSRLLRQLVEVIAEEMRIAYSGGGETTWKRPDVARGLEADESYYFRPEKIAADALALARGSDDIADYPIPDLAIEVDISPPQVDRPGIYAALGVAEVWRFDGKLFFIDRLTPDETYTNADASLFLPIRAQEIQHWLVDEVHGSESEWVMRLRAEFKAWAAKQSN